MLLLNSTIAWYKLTFFYAIFLFSSLCELKNKIMIRHTPVFCYWASFSSILGRKDFLWNLFIKWFPVAAINLDLNRHTIYLSTQCFRKAMLVFHPDGYGKRSTAKVLPLFSSVSDEDIARIANVKRRAVKFSQIST